MPRPCIASRQTATRGSERTSPTGLAGSTPGAGGARRSGSVAAASPSNPAAQSDAAAPGALVKRATTSATIYSGARASKSSLKKNRITAPIQGNSRATKNPVRCCADEGRRPARGTTVLASRPRGAEPHRVGDAGRGNGRSREQPTGGTRRVQPQAPEGNSPPEVAARSHHPRALCLVAAPALLGLRHCLLGIRLPLL